MTSHAAYTKPLTVFHGSYWEIPEEGDEWEVTAFDRPSASYNDDDVVYFSQKMEVAERFCSWRSTDPSGIIFMVLRGSLELRNPFMHVNAHEVEIGGEEFDWPMERTELYELLKANGYDAYVVPDNYGPGQDDIAVLDEDAFRPEGVKLKLDGAWTDWMEYDAAIELLNTHFPTAEPAKIGM